MKQYKVGQPESPVPAYGSKRASYLLQKRLEKEVREIEEKQRNLIPNEAIRTENQKPGKKT